MATYMSIDQAQIGLTAYSTTIKPPDQADVDFANRISGDLATLEGFSGDSDAFSMPEINRITEGTTGADGRIIYSSTGIKGGEVSLKFLANSKSVKPLEEIHAALNAFVDPKFYLWKLTFTDPINDITIGFFEGVLKTIQA